MEYTKPTSKAEMYATLKEMYNHYRLYSPVFTSEMLYELNLPKIDIVEKTEDEYRELALTVLSPNHVREIASEKSKRKARIDEIDLTMDNYCEQEKAEIDRVELEYKEKFKAQSISEMDRGVQLSCVTDSERESLACERLRALGKIKMEYGAKRAQLLAEKERLTLELGAVEEYFSPIHESEISAKIIELKDAEEKRQREIFKYNNSITEREIKYKNTLTQTRSNLELKFLEVRRDYTKAELIEMGYYPDVLNCVMDYYDTLPANDAYVDISGEADLIYYCDDYFDTLVNVYRLRAQGVQ